MSLNYAEGLSPYENKGKLGQPEQWDSAAEVDLKVSTLAEWIRNSRHVVVHTGAGISTSAGIPDFRGPRGVWTLERKGLKPDSGLNWDEAVPTKTHLAIAGLAREDRVKFVVSQNIDGLHLRSGLPRSKLAELHGNLFVDQCNVCKRQFVRGAAATTVGQKVSSRGCPARRPNGRPCRGRLADFVLDWEHELPDQDLDLSEAHSTLADLSIVLGSTLQIVPSGNLPTYVKRLGRKTDGKLVIVNLQPTKHDKKADLKICDYVDNVMGKLCELLDLKVPEYDADGDPVRAVGDMVDKYDYVEWTQCEQEAKRVKALAGELEEEFKRKRKAERERAKVEEEEEEEEEEERETKKVKHEDVVHQKVDDSKDVKDDVSPKVLVKVEEEEEEVLDEEDSATMNKTEQNTVAVN